MPKSKRNKQIDLSKTKKHGLEGKKKLFEEVRSCVETYTHLFIFSVNDMRNSKIKSVREQWKHSRFFIGKNKVMAKALGMNPEDEFRMNLHKIGHRLKGERGLLFSNQSIEEVLKWFSTYSEGDFARSGNRATETVVLIEGPLSQFPHNLEPYLRQLGLPTTLKKGIIHLVKDHTVCNVGDILTPETAKIVKLLGYEMAEFYIKIECVWSQDGSFSDFTTGEETKENIFNTNHTSSESKQTSNDVASMDVDDEEMAEPSDEMIESIIMKNRRSLRDSKIKEENKASSNESSEDEDDEMTDKKVKIEKLNDFSFAKVENQVSERESISNMLVKGEVTIASKTSPVKSSSPVEQNEDISVSVEDKKMPIKIEDKSDKTSEAIEDNLITNKDESMEEDVSDAVEETKTVSENDENKEEEISKPDLNGESITDNDESEDEEIPELVEDENTNGKDELADDTQSKEDNSESLAPNVNENSLKRLSLDKSALQSPVMLEKRPKFSPKMTRSAMKAKKTVSKTEAIKANDQTSDVNGKEQPQRGQSQKKQTTGESPAERKLRNRSIKIVKNKK